MNQFESARQVQRFLSATIRSTTSSISAVITSRLPSSEPPDHVPSLSAREFSLAYYRLAKRYHPDHGNNAGHDLMAIINAARTTILKASPHSN
jgi:hypothetical protein